MSTSSSRLVLCRSRVSIWIRLSTGSRTSQLLLSNLTPVQQEGKVIPGSNNKLKLPFPPLVYPTL